MCLAIGFKYFAHTVCAKSEMIPIIIAITINLQSIIERSNTPPNPPTNILNSDEVFHIRLSIRDVSFVNLVM